jgi:hypothetical protein
MKALQLLLPLLISGSVGLAQAAGLTSAIQLLPTCAVCIWDLLDKEESDMQSQQKCLITAVTSSPCELTDLFCICTDDKLQSDVEGCVMQSCTLRQSLSKYPTLCMGRDPRLLYVSLNSYEEPHLNLMSCAHPVRRRDGPHHQYRSCDCSSCIRRRPRPLQSSVLYGRGRSGRLCSAGGDRCWCALCNHDR